MQKRKEQLWRGTRERERERERKNQLEARSDVVMTAVEIPCSRVVGRRLWVQADLATL